MQTKPIDNSLSALVVPGHRNPLYLLLCVLATSLALGACAPAIGDECSGDSQCPSGAMCDKTVKKGYCTIRDCDKGTCPEDAVCIEFDDENTYCMQSCGSSEDCRDGYTCRSKANGEKTSKYCYIKK